MLKWIREFIKKNNIKVKLEKVRSHKAIKGNGIADCLAKLERISENSCHTFV